MGRPRSGSLLGTPEGAAGVLVQPTIRFWAETHRQHLHVEFMFLRYNRKHASQSNSLISCGEENGECVAPQVFIALWQWSQIPGM